MIGSLVQLRRSARDERRRWRPRPQPAPRVRGSARATRSLFRDRPIVPLLGPAGDPGRRVIELVQPGHRQRRMGRRHDPRRRSRWRSSPAARRSRCSPAASTCRSAAVASMAGFVVASLVGEPGHSRSGSSSRSSSPCSPGSSTGVGVGVFRVHPLIMTLGMGLVVLGLANVWQLQTVQTSHGRAARDPLDRLADLRSASCPYSLLVFVPGRGDHPARPAADRLRPPAVRDRRQPDRRAPVGRPRRGRS